MDDLFEENEKVIEPKKETPISSLKEESPMLPQEEMIEETKKKTAEPFSQDIQKELEAKFDELFGPIDEE